MEVIFMALSQHFLGCKKTRVIYVMCVWVEASPNERASQALRERLLGTHPAPAPRAAVTLPRAFPQLCSPVIYWPTFWGLPGAWLNGVTCVELRINFYLQVSFWAKVFGKKAHSLLFHWIRWQTERAEFQSQFSHLVFIAFTKDEE